MKKIILLINLICGFAYSQSSIQITRPNKVSGVAPIVVTNNTVISIPQANSVTDGYLSAVDWNLFNNGAGGWKTIGNALGTNTLFLGSTDNRSLIFKTNNTRVGKFDTLGILNIGTAVVTNTTGHGRLRINGGGINVDIGPYSGVPGYSGIWLSNIQPNANNFTLESGGAGGNDLYLNGPSDSADVSINAGNASPNLIQFHGNKTNSPLSTMQFNSRNRPNIAAGQNAPQFIFNSNNATKIFKGSSPLDYQIYVTPVTVGALVASTLTDCFVQWNDPPAAGTNMTITRKWGFGTSSSALISSSLVIGAGVKTPASVLDITGNILATTSILSNGKTQGIGYAVGSGSTITQASSRTTAVTINAINGAITLVSAAGLATYQTFQVTNSAVAATDLIFVNQKSGTDLYIMSVTNISAGSFKISFATTGGITVEQPVFNFAIIKGVTN